MRDPVAQQHVKIVKKQFKQKMGNLPKIIFEGQQIKGQKGAVSSQKRTYHHPSHFEQRDDIGKGKTISLQWDSGVAFML